MSTANHQAITSLHIDEARERAFRLLATASLVLPPPWTVAALPRMTLIDATEFAFHARRVIELCGLRKHIFPLSTPVEITSPSGASIPEMLSDFHEALNRLHHATEIEVVFTAWAGRKVWSAFDHNMIATFIRVRTDKLGPACLSIYSLANTYLVHVLDAVKAKHPTYLMRLDTPIS